MKFSTVFGASSSNSSIVMSPSLVFIVATDMPAVLSLLVGVRARGRDQRYRRISLKRTVVPAAGGVVTHSITQR